MRFSLELLRERMGLSAAEAPLVGDDGRKLARIRLATDDMSGTEPDTLYVAKRVPGGCDVDPRCAFVFTGEPSGGCPVPSLTLPGARSVPETLNEVTSAIDVLGTELEEIGELAWQEGGLARIAKKIEVLCGNPTYIVDSSFKVMAITDNPDMEGMSVNWMNAARYGYLSYDLIANLIRSDELYDLESATSAKVVQSNYFYTRFVNCNLRTEGRVQGHLFVVEMFKQVTAGDLEIIDIIAPFVMRAMLSAPAYQHYGGPYFEHFLVDWIEGRVHDQLYLQRQLDALALDSSTYPLVATFKMSSRSDFKLGRLARLLGDWQRCLAIVHDGGIVALFQLKDRGDRGTVAGKLRGICKSQNCRVAISDVQDSYHDMPRAYRQTLETFRICDAMGFESDVTCYGDVAAFQPYLNFSSADEVDDFLHPAVVLLRDYDLTHAVQLLPTLAEYLKNDRNVQATAERLFIHRNTLTYRMRRILELCPLDLDDFSTRQRLLESILIVQHYDRIVKSVEK